MYFFLTAPMGPHMTKEEGFRQKAFGGLAIYFLFSN